MSNVDYLKRKEAEVFKPLVDAEFTKLVNLAGADQAEVQKRLDAVDMNGLGPWGYLTDCIDATKDLIYTEASKAKLERSCLRHLWEPEQDLISYGGMTADYNEDDYEDDAASTVYGEYYPEEAHKALAQNYLWGGTDGDVFGIFSEGGIAKVFYTHPGDSFAILGEDPVDFFQKEVAVLNKLVSPQPNKKSL